MNWFRKQRKTDKREEGRRTKDDRPASLIPRLLVIFLALFTGFLMIHTAAVVSSPQNFITGGGLTGWAMTLLVFMAMGTMRRMGMFEAGLSGCVFSSRYCKARGTSAGESQEGSLLRICKLPSVRSLSVFSEHVCFCADNQKTSTRGQWPELSTGQIVSTSGAFLSFRMDENASQETYKAYNSEKNFGSDREFFKEITGQTYCKDGGANGVNAFRDKFSASVVNNCFHRLNNIIREWGCQAECLVGARP